MLQELCKLVVALGQHQRVLAKAVVSKTASTP